MVCCSITYFNKCGENVFRTVFLKIIVAANLGLEKKGSHLLNGKYSLFVNCYA